MADFDSRAGPPALTHHCIVRADLPRGTMAAQLVHAAGESVREALPSGVFAVVLAVDDEAALLRVHARLHDLGVPHCLVREPDAPWCGAAMAIGVVPIARNDRRIRAVLSPLCLL
jgi:peptidyl-tRNA hydrolase